ncbi:MAG: phosphate signaling complex protein PhoU [Porticoccaceae bacterium]|jgi:phosphate transport system protein|nr:MAG: phosphate signaling complex protein PhoU [Porticoccaceae bacterium]
MEKVSLDQHISRQFNADLEHLKSQTLAMGGMVEKQLHDAMMALELADSELAMQVLEAEKKIDEMELIIDDACTTTIARRQPAATDLRMILAVSRSVRDLERIGDEAQRIAKMAIGLSEEGLAPRGYVEARHIANGVRETLRGCLDAFSRFDARAARETMAKDKQIDLDYRSAVRELVTYMMEDPRSISRVMNVLWALRALERIGDHAKNICEHIVFLVEGKDIRHVHPDEQD